MARPTARFQLDQAVVFCGRAMRIAGVMHLQAASGQKTTRYLLAGESDSPAILEHAEDKFTQLRPFPAEMRLPASGSTVTVGKEKYSLVGVRKLSITAVDGQVPGGVTRSPTLLSGVFDGPNGTLMRELAPGTSTQTYYLVKALAPGDLVTEVQHELDRAAARRAAGERALDED
jgi:hypothetical protein